MIEELVDAGSLYSRSLDALVQELTADAQHLLSTDGDEAEMLEATLQAIAETQKQLLHMRKTTNNSLTAVNELQRSLHAKYSILYRDATGWLSINDLVPSFSSRACRISVKTS